jgi:hypothetical protein
MLMVDELVFAGPGFDSILATNDNIAKNTFLHDLVAMGTKKNTLSDTKQILRSIK